MANKIIAYHGSNRDLTKILGDGALFPFGEKVDERSYNAQALDKLIAQMAELGKKHLPECKDMSDWDAAYKFHMDGPRVIPMEDFNPLDYEYRESLRKSCIYLGDYEVAERHALGRDGHVLEFSSADGTLLPWGNFFLAREKLDLKYLTRIFSHYPAGTRTLVKASGRKIPVVALKNTSRISN